jgi:uncharacterized protein YbaR (Trm112 family)
MTPYLLPLLCEPETREPLRLVDAVYDARGHITGGALVTATGNRTYPIVRGIPRFLSEAPLRGSVQSFGDEWNHFNFSDFKAHWLQHTVQNTFGSVAAFRDKVIVDAGGGSGAQTLWMLQSGARHVIMLELSHSVDDVVSRNLAPSGFDNVDVVQCSIDAPPLLPRSIPGIVICHNVIQHTPSVEGTARALYDLVGDGGEFVFNCYGANDDTPLRWLRFHLIFMPIRASLRHAPFFVILSYARGMGVARLIPGLGTVLEKAGFVVQGDVPIVADDTTMARLRRRFQATVLNTFDGFGSHEYQHYKRPAEIRALLSELQPDDSRILNLQAYFSRPPPIGCALRVQR